MSAAGTRLALVDAEAVAARMRRYIAGESHIVGSVRRRKPEVGDVELIVHKEASVNPPVSLGLLGGEYEHVKGGGQPWLMWQLREVPTGCAIDLYRFDEFNRGSIMLIRTGPAAFSKLFVMKLRNRQLVHAGGYIRRDWGHKTIIPCPDEATAFKLAGMEWVDPEARLE